MVIPVSARLRERVEGPAYEAALERELATLSYRLREPGELEPPPSADKATGRTP
jgi:hypothetical protein